MDETLSRHILKLELSLLTPEVRQSAQRIGELLSDDFIEFTNSGKVYRYQRGDIFIAPVEGQIEDFALRSLLEECALATYRFIRADGSISLRSSVWQRIGDQWKIVFHQGTPVAQDSAQP